jgi:bacterioferritin (cytochrome b1)
LQSYKQILNGVQQYEAQLKMLKNIDPSQISKMLTEAGKQSATLSQYTADLNSLYGDANSLSGIFQTRYGTSLNDFLKTGGAAAAKSALTLKTADYLRAQTNEATLRDRMQGTYERIQTYQAQIPATEGQQASLQLLNTQMNALLDSFNQFNLYQMSRDRMQAADREAALVKDDIESRNLDKLAKRKSVQDAADAASPPFSAK